MGAHDDAMGVIRLLARCDRIDLSTNPWEYPPAAVVARGLDIIRGYYEELPPPMTPLMTRTLKVVLLATAELETPGKHRLVRHIATSSVFREYRSFRQTCAPTIRPSRLVLFCTPLEVRRLPCLIYRMCGENI